MKKLVAKIPLLIMVVCLFIGVLPVEDGVISYFGGAPWIIN
ncbi:hypothetical protein NQ117_15315 [Paenibacillus sp. SC116]|nr:hypothetical protein [Paenibacillus sp. SC116]MCR8845051.1 hypothetical protein [Paenibacillus sp. SC116]